MKLVEVEVEGYRSIRDPLRLVVEPNVTVMLGANDHGKTNLIDALRHLNADAPFNEADLNWDCMARSKDLPRVAGRFSLSDDEREALLAAENEAREAVNASANAGPTSDPEADVEGATAEGATTDSTEPATQPKALLKLRDIPDSIYLSREGLMSQLAFQEIASLEMDASRDFLNKHSPRVELIRPIERIVDSARPADIDSETHEFMRGIFYYAGITSADWPEIFRQTDVTTRRLTDASDRLNETLRRSWSQGADLGFRLEHYARNSSIQLRVKDPAVENRFVEPSRRSAGFTHFFALKTILHARHTESRANSYIWLFDEPGLYLHPAGQQDLIQALETIGRGNQVLYTTHSLFLINKNFPARHRLVAKTASGTCIDSKPFLSHWRSALQALGLSLPGTVLFASYVLLTEGDSDPLLLYAVLQRLAALGEFTADLNSFAVVSTGDSRNADALARMLLEANPRPRLAILVDGDRGGSARLEDMQPLIDRYGIPVRQLANGTTLEDHLPLAKTLYVEALGIYLAKILDDKGKEHGDLAAELTASFERRFGGPKGGMMGIASWAREEGQRLGNLAKPPSSIGIAREYAALLESADEADLKKSSVVRARTMAEWIRTALELPGQTVERPAIVEE